MTGRNHLKFAMFSRDVQWGIVAFIFFPLTIWWIWIFFIYRFIFYRKTNKVLLKGTKKEPIRKRDMRFKAGYRIDNYVEVSFYEWHDATENDLIQNKKKANIFLLYLGVNIVLIYITLIYIV